METNYDQVIVNDLKKKAGKEFSNMTDADFFSLMKKQPKESLEQLRGYLISSRDFYKRILLEQYKIKHPNSFRYRDAEEQIAKHNVKGKLLKEISDTK